MTRAAAIMRLRELAKQLGRLRPDWGNPERYFEERDELRSEMQRLANRMDQSNG
jgi:hypothetical protein